MIKELLAKRLEAIKSIRDALDRAESNLLDASMGYISIDRTRLSEDLDSLARDVRGRLSIVNDEIRDNETGVVVNESTDSKEES